jgi:hypothetical protein
MGNVVKLVTSDPAQGLPRRTARTKPIDKIIGEAVRLERKAQDKSMEWLADEVGVTYQQIGKIEHGINRLSVARLFDIAEALEFDPADFVKDIALDASAEASTARSGLRKALGMTGATELMLCFAAVSAEDRRLILALARRLSQADDGEIT